MIGAGLLGLPHNYLCKLGFILTGNFGQSAYLLQYHIFEEVNPYVMGAVTHSTIALEELFKAASKTEKASIESMSGLRRATMYKAIGTGNLSAKLAVSIAQTLNVNPFYLTGESDDRGTCSDKIIRNFLIGKDKAYEKLLAGTKPGRKPRAAKPAAANTAPKGTRKSK